MFYVLEQDRLINIDCSVIHCSMKHYVIEQTIVCLSCVKKLFFKKGLQACKRIYCGYIYYKCIILHKRFLIVPYSILYAINPLKN